MAVALVIFARWNPLACFAAALLFGAAGALGPALQSVGISKGYYFFNAVPYLLTLAIMIVSVSPKRSLRGALAELSDGGAITTAVRQPRRKSFCPNNRWPAAVRIAFIEAS